MMREAKLVWLLMGILALSALACSSAPEQGAAGAGNAEAESRPAQTLPIPSGSGGELPPGHPPTGGSTALVWDKPAGWTEETPSSNMRYAQYSIDGPGGPAECVVFYFGPNQGGDPMANANRWAGQFAQPDGSSSVEAMTIEQLDDSSVPVYVVEVTGTYNGGMTGSAEPFDPQPDAMLLGGIAEGPDAPWFFKFTGPESTVSAQRDAFVDMMRSIRAEG